MKKSRRFMKLSAFAVLCASLLVTGASATSYTFINKTVPVAQGYQTLPSVYKSTTSSDGFVSLTQMTPDAVTFSARATNASYGGGTIVYQTNMEYTVNYTNSYGPGQEMNARFRNHNWSLNSNTISGTFEYK